VKVTALERADQKAHIAKQLASLRGTQHGRVLDTPPVKPFFQWIYVADDGRIWVKIHTKSERSPERLTDDSIPPLRWREPNVMDVFEPTGTYIGRVRMPDDVRIIRLRQDRIWAVVRDEFDVEYVKRYRVNWR